MTFWLNLLQSINHFVQIIIIIIIIIIKKQAKCFAAVSSPRSYITKVTIVKGYKRRYIIVMLILIKINKAAASPWTISLSVQLCQILHE